MAFPSHQGSNLPSPSKYASPAQRNAQLTAINAVAISASFTPKTTTTTPKQPIAARETIRKKIASASELVVQQDVATKKQVEEHMTKSSRAISTTITNTHQLLALLRNSTLGSEVAEGLWMELEQFYEAANDARAGLPNLMGKERDDENRHHSSTISESIHGNEDSVILPHKMASTPRDLTLEQQDASLHTKAQTSSQLEEVESLQERISHLTLENDKCRTDINKCKKLLESENARKVEDLRITDALQKELQTLVSSKMQLQAENETLRKMTTDMLEQLKKTEQHVVDRFVKELEAKANELQKETGKTALLNTLISTLNNGESTLEKLDKVKSGCHLVNFKHDSHAPEYAAALTTPDEQNAKIGILAADVDRLQKQNASLQAELEKASELAEANKELSKTNSDLSRQLDDLLELVNEATDDTKAAQVDLKSLEAELVINDTAAATKNDNALLEKINRLEEKKDSLEAALAEWAELAKRSYKEYKEMLPICRQAMQHRQQALDKEAEIDDLKLQLATAKTSQSSEISTSAGDAAYWKQKYETLLSTID